MKLEKFQIHKMDTNLASRVLGGVDGKKTFKDCIEFIGYTEFGYKMYSHTVTYDDGKELSLPPVIDDSCKEE